MWLLCISNVASLLAALNLVIWLEPDERISVPRGSALTVLGLVYFTSLFEILNVWALYTEAGSRIRHQYALSHGDVLDINNKLVSAVQAVYCVATGVVVCSHSCRRDFMRASHYMSEAYAWFGAAYFFYDIWSMYMVHIQMVSGGESMKEQVRRRVSERKAPVSFLKYCAHEPVILLHHVFIGGFGFLVIVHLRGSLGDCAFGWVYGMEASTPLVCARGVLARLRLKRSPLYLANGLLMLLTFLLCRVLSLPYVCWLYSRELGLTYAQAIQSLPTGCKISICILLLPQLYWFYLMSAGALKMLFRAGKPAELDGKAPRPTPPADRSAGDATEVTDKHS